MERLIKNTRQWFARQDTFPLSRVSGHYALAFACLIFPEVGDNRFLLAGIIALVLAPGGYYISKRFHRGGYSTVDHMIDMFSVVLLVHLTPESWYTVLLIGVVLAQAPAITVQDNSHIRYSIAYAVLISGMAIAGYVHNIEGWLLPLAILTLLVPSVIYYALREMRAAAELKEKAMATDSLRLVAGSVAHDFNNILTSITVNAEMLLQSSNEGKKDASSAVQVIEGAQRASLLAKQLLSFSGGNVAERSTLNAREEIETVVGIARSVAKHDLSFEVSAPDKLPNLLGDPSMIQQVFLNLLINAAEASAENGRITVSIQPISSEMLEFTIVDEGSGIDAVSIKRIFDPFFTSKRDGHGLGLAAVQRIVSEHNGTIEITSEKDQGTRAVLRLPASSVETTPQPAAVDAPSFSNRQTVLIADDEPAIRQLVAAMLEQMGYKLLAAEDGSACVSLFEAHASEIRAAVLDLKMPGKTGWECLQLIREKEPQLPVLLISGFNPAEADIDRNDRWTRFLPKPFGVEEFESVFSVMLESPAKRSPG